MIKSPSKMAGIIIFVLLFSSEYDIFVLNNNVLGVLTMNKVKANLIKAIEDKTNAYKQLSIKDIVELSQAVKNLSEIKASENGVMYGCDDDNAIGFCD